MAAVTAVLSGSGGNVAWKMPAHCGPNPDVVETPRNWIPKNYELNKTGSYPPELVKQLFHAPDAEWQDAVENGACDASTWARYRVRCAKGADGRQVYKFPPGSLAGDAFPHFHSLVSPSFLCSCTLADRATALGGSHPVAATYHRPLGG